jgi:hypothetical protein
MPLPYEIQGPVKITTESLLFWPNNPRLKISDFNEVQFTTCELLHPHNQDHIRDLLVSHEQHDVRALIKSILNAGFMPERAPIVMNVRSTDRYIVLEGNRRLAAIRTILAAHRSEASGFVLESIREIPCYLFVHTSADVPLEAAISRMVAEAHIKGQRPHTKLQQAHMLYNAYTGFLSEEGVEEFKRDETVLRETAEFFGLRTKNLEEELSVVCLYKQLRAAGHDVPHTFHERLTWPFLHPRPFGQHFGYSRFNYSLSEEGLDRFFDLFVRKDCAVHNPSNFNKFRKIMRLGQPHHIELLRTAPHYLEAIEQQVQDQSDAQHFEKQLNRIRNGLRSIKVSEYSGSAEQKRVIFEICELANDRLHRLVGEPQGPDQTTLRHTKARSSHFRIPVSIEEATRIPIDSLADQILAEVSERPDRSCVRAKLPRYLLQRWVVKTGGASRTAFSDRVERAVELLIERGRLIAYRSNNNARVRML